MYVGIVGCSLIIQSCEKEIFEQSLETDELYNSEEFREYLSANIDLFNEYKKAHNKTIAVKGKNGTLVLSTKNVRISLVSTYSIDSKLLINLASKREQLIAKYPSYINFIEKGKKLAIKETILSSENLSKRLLGKNNISNYNLVRLKSLPIEGSGTYSYDDYLDAFIDAMCYSDTAGVECGGFVFEDGTAILYISPYATSNSGRLPVPGMYCDENGMDISFYNGNVIESTYHTHPDHFYFSGTDNNTQSQYFPNSDLIILYNDSAYVYHYEYGFYIP
ncbi:MAG: hypothetical protein GYA02_11390 [Clostridiaceae bacterium]|nr:hypothetical protein [Clostridiaceae bacterium]